MFKLKNLFSFYLICIGITISGAQNLPPEVSATGDQNYCSSSPIAIATSVSITDPDASDTTLNEVFIQISEGYANGSDILALIGSHPNISAVWDSTLGQLTLIGPATFSEFEDAILATEFSTTQLEFTTDRSFSINLGNANFLPSTGHYYFYVSDFGIPWNVARNDAAAMDYFGLQGYLATITTQEEAQLAGEQAVGVGWIGATDEETEGIWKWVTGPESGLEFFDQNTFTPINGEFSFWNTGEPNNFGAGGEDYAHVTDPSVGQLGSWNDLPLGGDPDVNGPYHPQGYIVEFGGLPGDPDINLSAATILRMPQLQVTDVTGCEGDFFNLSVITNLDNIIWYDDPQLTNQVNTGTTYDVTLNNSTIFYITGNFANCSTTLVREFSVNLNPAPQAVDTVITQCDDISADGISSFELNIYSGLITNGSSSNTVSYFEDLALSAPINALVYENTVNGQVIYAKVENPTTNCFSVAEVTLNVSPPSDDSYSLEICDDETEDGLAEFNLSNLNDEVLSGFPANAQTSFFATFNDALGNDNALPNNYINTIPNAEIIYVKVSDGAFCLGINEVELIVLPLPELRPDETVYYCLNEFPTPIILDGGIINDIPNNYYYNWSTGETTIEIEVNEPGTYTVEVTEVDGCTNIRTITVLPSTTADFSIEITDASENNSITVMTTGEGNYEYALNAENGPYQDSNTFDNVPAGIQTVYVRDKNGCGVRSESFPVIGFPKFFTPNGDGQNDFWTIKGFDAEFLSSAIVNVYDRHGKLLTQLSANNPFWDGDYNGNPMPSNDYWFSVTLQDGRQFTKHFSLKR